MKATIAVLNGKLYALCLAVCSASLLAKRPLGLILFFQVKNLLELVVEA